MVPLPLRALELLLTPLMLGLLAAPASSQWIPSGAPLCQGPCDGDMPQILADGAGGAFVVWREARNYSLTGTDVYLQRISASGTIPPGWPAGALPVCAAPKDQNPYALAPDGQGGVLVVWDDFRNTGSGGTGQDLYAQRVLADGSIAPGWIENGVPACTAPAFQSLPAIAPDGAGGAYIAWEDERDYATHLRDIYAQHLTSDGVVAQGWPVNGLAVCNDPADAGAGGIVADGSGGVVVVWGDLRRGVVDVYAQHLLADGSLAPGWAANGLLVAPGSTVRQVAADDAGGFYVGCATFSSLDLVYRVQRFSFEGTRAPGWPEAGVVVCGAADNRGGLRMAADGLGGMLLAWYDYRPPTTGGEIYAARVLADGSLAPGWTVDGTRVSDATSPSVEYTPDIAPDGSGGAYVVWQSQMSYVVEDPSWVQHLTRNATVAAGWPQYGVRLAPSLAQLDSRIAYDGRRGAIVTWDEACCGRIAVFAQRFVLDGPVAVLLSLVSAVAEPERVTLVWHAAEGASLAATVERRGTNSDWAPLATVTADGTGRIAFEDRSVSPGERYAYRLAYSDEGVEHRSAETWVDVPRTLALALDGLRPNPAVGPLTVSFTLPSAAPATLALVDVSGRRILEREVGSLGAGRHLLRLDEAPHLAPGMYWLRLTQGGHALITRVVVVR
jgi:hypothetical protein